MTKKDPLGGGPFEKSPKGEDVSGGLKKKGFFGLVGTRMQEVPVSLKSRGS